MSSVKIQGSATGTANFTIAVPAGTSTDRTINLPDAAGSFVLADASGNVGIGTASPSTILTLDSGGTPTTLKIDSFTESSIDFDDKGGSAKRYKIGTNISSNDGQFEFKDMTANAERMRISSDGSVGIGTTSSYPLTVQSGTAGSSHAIALRNNSSTNISRLGFVQQDSATAAYTSIDGDGRSTGFLRFNTNDTERARIVSGGQLCINQTDAVMASRTCKIAINQDNATGFGLGINNIRNDTSGSGGIVTKNNEVSGTFDVMSILNSGGTEIGIINANNSAVGFTSTSDYRLKENVVELTGAIDRVKTLQPKRFNFISDPDVTVDGFIAHEVSDAVPEAVTGTKDAMRDEQYEVTPAVLDDDGNVVTEAVMGTRQVPKYQGIDPAKLVPLLTAAIKEQQALIEDLQTRLAALEAV